MKKTKKNWVTKLNFYLNFVFILPSVLIGKTFIGTANLCASIDFLLLSISVAKDVFWSIPLCEFGQKIKRQNVRRTKQPKLCQRLEKNRMLNIRTAKKNKCGVRERTIRICSVVAFLLLFFNLMRPNKFHNLHTHKNNNRTNPGN